MKSLPVIVCPACGSILFRQATLSRFLDDRDAQTDRISTIPMTILICFCGTPLRPGVGGVHAEQAVDIELKCLFKSLDSAEEHRRGRCDLSPLAQNIMRDFVPGIRFDTLERTACSLERQVGRLLARGQSGRSKQGRHWTMPERAHASKAKGRDWLVVQLQQSGFTFDQGREIVCAILDSITERLKAGECVETPLGVFGTAMRPKPKTNFRIRRGKLQKMRQDVTRVIFIAKTTADCRVEQENSHAAA